MTILFCTLTIWSVLFGIILYFVAKIHSPKEVLFWTFVVITACILFGGLEYVLDLEHPNHYNFVPTTKVLMQSMFVALEISSTFSILAIIGFSRKNS